MMNACKMTLIHLRCFDRFVRCTANCKFFNVSNVLVKTLVTELVETMYYLDYSRKRWFRMRILFGDVMLSGANRCQEKGRFEG